MPRPGAFGVRHFPQPLSGVGGLGAVAPTLQPRLRRLRGGLGDAPAPPALTWEAAKALYDEVTRREQNPPPVRVETDTADCTPYWGLDVYQATDCTNIASLIYADLWIQAKASLAALASRGVVPESGYTKSQSRQRYYNACRILIEVMVRAANMRFIVMGRTLGALVNDPELMLAGTPDDYRPAPYKVAAPFMLPNFSMSFMTGSGCSGHHSNAMPEGGPFDGPDVGMRDFEDPGGNTLGSGLTYYRMWLWRRDKCPKDDTPANGTFLFTLSNLAYGSAFPGNGVVGDRAAILNQEIPPGMVHAPVVLRNTVIPDVLAMDGRDAVPFMLHDPDGNWVQRRETELACDSYSGCVWRLAGTTGLGAMTGATLVARAAEAASRWSQMNLLQFILDCTTNYLTYYSSFVAAGLVGAPDPAVVGAQKAVIQAHRNTDENLVWGVYGTVAAGVNVIPVVGQALSAIMAIGAGIAKALLAIFDAIIQHNYPCPAPMNMRIYDTCGIDPQAAQGVEGGRGVTQSFTQAVAAAAATQARATSHDALLAHFQSLPPVTKKTSPWLIGGGIAAALGAGFLVVRAIKRKRKG
jgi:hypothetical protein